MFRNRLFISGVLASLLMAACGDDGTKNPVDGPDAGTGPIPTTFTVKIENISGSTGLPGPFAPGVWAAHTGGNTLFTPGEVASAGLEELAEDGSPGTLHDSLTNYVSRGVFTTPDGESAPGPLLPGGAYEFTLNAFPGDNSSLDIATMLVQTNDIFAAVHELALFNTAGEPISGDITDQWELWQAGTEQDQVPGIGPDQAPRQSAANTGASESTIRQFSDTTRALPPASALVSVTVTEAGGVYTVTLKNVSAELGLAVTPMAPVFFSNHNDNWSLFTAGMPDEGMGLESLAEDGSPAALVAAHSGSSDATVGAMAMPTGEAGPGPLLPGASYQFDVTPTSSQPLLSLASMVVQSNDAFIATEPGGVALLNEDGSARSAADVTAELQAALFVWDAGTEENQVPGTGATQPIRQAAANTGAVDTDNLVRKYHDTSNDYSDTSSLITVNVALGSTADSLAITLTNISAASPSAVVFTPTNYTLHDDTVMYFEPGGQASAGLESLAEDGNPATLQVEQAAIAGVGLSANAAVPNGSNAPGPLLPGASYTFEVTPDASNRFLNFATMLVPSNDTFVGLVPEGIALMDSSGTLLAPAAIEAALTDGLRAWDAGTEGNEASALGASQAPVQAGPNTGASEGDGTVRLLNSPWPVPSITDLLRVTITPN